MLIDGHRNLFSRRAISVLLTVVLLWSIPVTPARAQGPATAITFAALIDSVNGLIKTLESSARALLEQGNDALAQQQLILASTLRSTIKQIQDAYASSLQKTYDALTVTEKNTFDNLKDLANNVEKQMSQDVSDLVFQTQSAANQLLDRLPLTHREPVLMGAKVKEFLGTRDQSDADIALLGYMLADPRLNYEKPDIKVNGKAIPPQNVGWFYDRVNIQIPDSIKEEIRFANKPCDPRKTFAIEATVHYKKDLAFGFGWSTTADLTTNALAGRVAFDVTVTATGERNYTTPEPIGFVQRSPYISVGCEEAAGTQVNYVMPTIGKNLQGHGDWVETSNLKGQSANVVINGDTITATGTINGLDKQGAIIKNCPGGGHAVLALTGSYTVDTAHTESYSYPQTATLANTKANFSLPVEVSVSRTVATQFASGNFFGSSFLAFFQGAMQNALNAASNASGSATPSSASVKYHSIRVEIRRKDCPDVIDTITINVPASDNQQVAQTSVNGKFKATYQLHTVEVEPINQGT